MRTASFRGLEFDWEEAPITFGRQTSTHLYPDRVNKNGVVAESRAPYVEDPCAKARTLHMTAVFIGPNCEADASDFRKACEAPGPGRLVHPIEGELDAICETGSQVIDQTSNIARLDLSFQEAGQADLAATRGLIDLSDDAITAALAMALARLVWAMNLAAYLEGMPAAMIESVRQAIASVESTIKSLMSPAFASQIKGSIGALGLQVASLVATPAELAHAWSGVFEGMDASDLLRIVPSLASQGGALTPAGATTDLLIIGTAATACTAALAVPGESDVDARALGSRLSKTLLAAAALASCPDQRADLVSMAATTTAALNDLAGTLPQLRVVNVPRPTPLLALIADLFPGQDPERAALAIMRRNPTANAMFVPAGRLEVVNA